MLYKIKKKNETWKLRKFCYDVNNCGTLYIWLWWCDDVQLLTWMGLNIIIGHVKGWRRRADIFVFVFEKEKT